MKNLFLIVLVSILSLSAFAIEKEEPAFETPSSKKLKNLQANLMKNYGRYFPHVKVAQKLLCSKKPLSEISKSDVKAEFSRFTESQWSAISDFIDKVSYQESKNYRGDLQDLLIIHLSVESSDNSLPKKIEIRKTHDSKVAFPTIVIKSEQYNSSGDVSPLFLANMVVSDDCTYSYGMIWFYELSGEVKIIDLDYDGAIYEVYWQKKNMESLASIYQHCTEKMGKTFDEIIKSYNEIEKVHVAILDTGIDYNHPSLAYKISRNKEGMINGWDFLENDSLPYDSSFFMDAAGVFDLPVGHGTSVASIIAKDSNNIEIIPLRYVDNPFKSNPEKHYSSIKFAYEKGARIINISQGSKNLEVWEPLREAMIDYPDVLFVLSAGNDGENVEEIAVYPGEFNLPNIINVAAIDNDNHIAEWSNYGEKKVHIAAPGVSIMAATPGNKYEKVSGTSFAAPHVAKVAAKIKAINPSLSPLQIKDIILKSVRKIDSLSGKVLSGGVLDAKKAMKMAGKSKQ